MRIRKFNESAQTVVQDIRECFIDLVESTISDDITIDEALYFNEEYSQFWATIGLPCLGFDFIIDANNDFLPQMIEFNNEVTSRYQDIINCIEKVKSLYPNIEYIFEITCTETEKVTKNIYIPYMQYIEIAFKI